MTTADLSGWDTLMRMTNGFQDSQAIHVAATLGVAHLTMLVILGGRERTADEFGSLYDQAGFTLTNIIPTASPFSIIEGAPA